MVSAAVRICLLYLPLHSGLAFARGDDIALGDVHVGGIQTLGLPWIR